jgi:hypothetical protein
MRSIPRSPRPNPRGAVPSVSQVGAALVSMVGPRPVAIRLLQVGAFL